MKHVIVKKDSYYDSVVLMQLNAKIREIKNINNVKISMGTPQNKETLFKMGFSDIVLRTTANDLIIAFEVQDKESISIVEESIKEILKERSEKSKANSEYKPSSLASSIKLFPEANFVIISIPGTFAAIEARKALNEGLHVMLFSDNVPVEAEIELKKIAKSKGLLLMGPDCGTAIINGVPLGFANEIKRGHIGIIGASGTGIQEVSCLIDRLGEGISQVIGTGGRDLHKEIGGKTMMQGIETLSHDPQTHVIVVVSKVPDEEAGKLIVSALVNSGKPCVLYFIGKNFSIKSNSIIIASSFEEVALMAISCLKGTMLTGSFITEYNLLTTWYEEIVPEGFIFDENKIEEIVKREINGKSPRQKYIRGYFTGGSLCEETLFILSKEIKNIFCNIHPEPSLRLIDPNKSIGHSLIDLGDDVFTRGHPHPMIDPTIRNERILSEIEDDDIALMLIDIVLGYGSNPDPVGAILPYLIKARDKALSKHQTLTVIASIVGTDKDPQNYLNQREKLESEGFIVMPSNAQAAKLALKCIKGINPKL